MSKIISKAAAALFAACLFTLSACSSDDDKGGEDKYAYCVFMEQQTCLSGSFASCQNGGNLSQTCPFNVDGLSSGGTGGGSSSSVGGVDVGSTYIITGSGAAFTATKGGVTVGTAGQPIRTVFGLIRTDANGANVGIQFGDGTSALNIVGSGRDNEAIFEGEWGNITISGKITAESEGAISIRENISMNSTADIKTNKDSRDAIDVNANSTLTISGGTVSAVGGSAISVRGTLIVNGGTIYDAIYGTGGTITINGGTVYGNSVVALKASNGTSITINGGTISTGASMAIEMNGNNNTLSITNGTVKATATDGRGIFVYNHDTATISGGTVEAKHEAIWNNGGAVTISGGTISSSYNRTSNSSCAIISDGNLIISGGTVKNTGTGYSVCGTATIGADAIIIGDTNGVN